MGEDVDMALLEILDSVFGVVFAGVGEINNDA